MSLGVCVIFLVVALAGESLHDHPLSADSLLWTALGAVLSGAAAAALIHVAMLRPLSRLEARVRGALQASPIRDDAKAVGEPAWPGLGEAVERMQGGLDAARRAAVEREARLNAIFSNAAVGLGVIGAEGTFEQVNGRLAEMLGYAPEEMIGHIGVDIVHPDDLLEILPSLDRRTELREVDMFRVEVRCARKDGGLIWTDLSASGLRGPEGALDAIILVAVDVTETKRVQAELAALSRRDSLTDLANRRAFEEVLEREWRRSLRTGRSVGIVMCDVDRFKTYNDEYGHLAGDECLKQLADVLRQCFRDGVDLAARWGGEEFAVIVVETDAEEMAECSERLRARVEEVALPRPGQTPDHVTVSVGAVALPADPSLEASVLTAAADAALYQSKREGRNRVTIGSVAVAEEAAPEAPPEETT